MMLTVHPLLVPQRVQCHSFESTEERLSGTTCGGEVNVPKKQVVSLKLPVLLSLRLGRSGGWHFRMAPAKTSCIGGPNLLASISSSVRWTSSQSSRHDTVVVSDGINQNHAHGNHGKPIVAGVSALESQVHIGRKSLHTNGTFTCLIVDPFPNTHCLQRHYLPPQLSLNDFTFSCICAFSGR